VEKAHLREDDNRDNASSSTSSSSTVAGLLHLLFSMSDIYSPILMVSLSALNPFLYAIYSQKFRMKLNQLNQLLMN
jgi:hypothetical protein